MGFRALIGQDKILCSAYTIKTQCSFLTQKVQMMIGLIFKDNNFKLISISVEMYIRSLRLKLLICFRNYIIADVI